MMNIQYVKADKYGKMCKWCNRNKEKCDILLSCEERRVLLETASHYQHCVYFISDEEDELSSIFEVNKNPHRIIELLSLIAGEKIEPGKTLILFDEVQECPAALNALKHFKEKANGYHVIAAGSLLEPLLAQPKSYPVGMVNLLNIYPLGRISG